MNGALLQPTSLGDLAITSLEDGGGPFARVPGRAKDKGAVLPVLALNSRVVNFGDSITDFGDDTDPSWGAGYAAWGYQTWAQILGGARLYEPIGGNLGVDGNTTTQMLARVANMDALSPDIVRVLGGVNDIYLGHSTATTIANLAAIYAHIRSIGARIIACRILPTYAPEVFSPADDAKRNEINAWIAAQAAADLKVIDGSSLAAGDFRDGLHLNASGGYKLGSLIAAAEAPWLDSLSFVDDFFAGTILSTNPTLAGTGGTDLGGNVTGPIATGWSGFSDTTTTAFTLAKNGSDEQTISFSGAADLYGLYFSQTVSPASPVGKTFEAIAEVEITSALTGIASITIYIECSTSGGAVLANRISPSPIDSTVATPMVPGTYILRSPPILAPATTAKITVSITPITRDAVATCAGAITVKRIGFREVPAGA